MYLTIATIGFAGGLICMNFKHKTTTRTNSSKTVCSVYMDREFAEQVEMFPLSLIGVAGILSKR